MNTPNQQLSLETLFETLSPKELDSAWFEFSSRLKLFRTGDRIHALHGYLQFVFDTKQKPLSTQGDQRKKCSNYPTDFSHELHPLRHADEVYQPTHSKPSAKPQSVNLSADPSMVAEAHPHHPVKQLPPKNEHQPLLSPIQQIRLSILNTHAKEDVAYFLIKENPNLPATFLEHLELLAQWCVAGIPSPPPENTAHTTQTNNDESSAHQVQKPQLP